MNSEFFVVGDDERPALASWDPVYRAVESGKTVFVPVPDGHPDPHERAKSLGSGLSGGCSARGFRVTTRVRNRQGSWGVYLWRTDDG